jgi:hypothetical protein
MQLRSLLIQKIFEHVPFTYKGVNRNGEHIIQIENRHATVYATLERLSQVELSKLASKLNITLHEECA